MPDDNPTSGDAQIPTNLRLLLILEEVARTGVPIKPSVIGERLGLPKPTIHRLFQTAEAEGFLQRDIDGRSYGPGRRLRALAVSTISAQNLRMTRLAVMKGVAEEVGETTNLATPDREGMTYLDRVETKWPLRIQLPIGTRVPFHCTASGKMYLSSLKASLREGFLTARPLVAETSRTMTDPTQLLQELKETRQRGYSTDDEEFMEGMTAIAVPVLDNRGRLLATLSVHAPIQRHTVTSLLGYLPVLKSGAEALSTIVED